MRITALVAAAADGGFLVGLAIGLCIGFLIGPAVRSWLAVREWAEASRQARLADRVIARMETESEPGRGAQPGQTTSEEPVRSWRPLP